MLIALGKKGIVSVYRAESERTHDGVKNIRFEACGNVCRVLVLLLGDLRLVVEGLVAQGLELLARVLFALGSGVVIAESAERKVNGDTRRCSVVPGTYAWRPRILLAFSSGAMCSILDDVVVSWEALGC